MKNRNPIYVAVLGVLALMLIVALPATRAAASEFLGIFRVQKFAPISISPQQLTVLEDLAGEGVYPGELTMLEQPGERISFDSPQALIDYFAEQENWMYVRTLPALGDPSSVSLEDGGAAQLTIDLDGARRIVEAVGIDPQRLPDSLDGATLTARIQPQVVQQWDDSGLIFVQMASPEIDYPTDVDPTVIGEALLRFLGMDNNEAYRLANNLDWTNTLLLPIPAEFATFQEVLVDGTTGVAIQPLDGQGTTLMWQQYGSVLLVMSETATVEELVTLVEATR